MADFRENWHARYQRKMRAMLILFILVCLAIISLLTIHALMVGQGSLLYDLWYGSFAIFGSAAMFSGLAFPVVMVLFAFLILPVLIVFLLLSKRRNR